MPRKILVLFAHPAYERSRVNRRLARVAREAPSVTFHDLYEAYPDLVIDVDREQKLLTEHDVILFQHPFFWYSCPAIVKEWTDQVLEHGWAYGKSGTALTGKLMMLAITTGGGSDAYRREGYNRFTIRQFLTPQEQTARLCRMKFLAPFVVHDVLKMERKSVTIHEDAYRRTLQAIAEDRIDVARAEDAAEISEAILDASTTEVAS